MNFDYYKGRLNCMKTAANNKLQRNFSKQIKNTLYISLYHDIQKLREVFKSFGSEKKEFTNSIEI